MNIATIFYLGDVFFRFSFVVLVLIVSLSFLVFMLFISVVTSYGEEEIKRKKDDFIQMIKKISPFYLALILLFIFLPSKNAIYIYGGQRAVFEISKNKDSQEIITLIKNITINKLRELEADKGDKK